MKKIGRIAALLSMIFILSSCQTHKEVPMNLAPSGDLAESNYCGVIVTTGEKNESYIEYFDKDLKLKRKQKLDYGTLGSTFTKQQVKDNIIYTTAQGLAQKKNLGLVLGIDAATGKVEEYSHGLVGPAAHVVTEQAIYVCNNLNFVSNVVRIDRHTKEKKSLELSVHQITNVCNFQDKILVFAMNYENDGSISSYIYIIDEDLNVEKQIDITEVGSGSDHVCFIENKLYFNTMMTGNSEDSTNIGILDLNTYSVSTISLGMERPFCMAYEDGKMFISQYQFDEANGTMAVIDLASGKQDLYGFEHPVNQMEVKDGKLLMSSSEEIYQYSITEGEILLEQETSLEMPTNVKYYVGGIFYLNE